MKTALDDLQALDLAIPPKEIMTFSDWLGYRQDFREHFFLGDSNSYVPDSSFAFKWSALKQLFDRHQSITPPQPAEGISFSYGMRNDQFTLVAELYGRNINNELIIIPDTRITADGNEVDESTRLTLQEEYISRVWVKPFNIGSSRPFKATTSTNKYGDVIGTHYPWWKILKLYTDNIRAGHIDPMVVVTSISAELTDLDTERQKWRADGELDSPRFRHLLSLHIAVTGPTGGRLDLISDSGSPNYGMRAVDYGSVCPANCPKRQA